MNFWGSNIFLSHLIVMSIGVWVAVGLISASAISYVMATEPAAFKGGGVTTGGKQSSSSSTTSTTPQPPDAQTTTADSAPSVITDPDESMHDGGTQPDKPPKGTDDSPAATDTTPDTTMPKICVKDNHGNDIWVTDRRSSHLQPNLPPGMQSRPNPVASQNAEQEAFHQPSKRQLRAEEHEVFNQPLPSNSMMSDMH